MKSCVACENPIFHEIQKIKYIEFIWLDPCSPNCDFSMFSNILTTFHVRISKLYIYFVITKTSRELAKIITTKTLGHNLKISIAGESIDSRRAATYRFANDESYCISCHIDGTTIIFAGQSRSITFRVRNGKFIEKPHDQTRHGDRLIWLSEQH